MKTILIVTWTPLSKYTYQKVYRFDELSKKFKVLVFDITTLIFKGHKDSLYDRQSLIKAYKIKTLSSYLKKINNIKIDLVINLTGIRKQNIIFEEFVKKNIGIVNFINEHLIEEDYFFPSNIIKYIKYFIKKCIYSSNVKQNINIIGGSSFSNLYSSINAKIIRSHSMNYNTLLRANLNKKNKIKKHSTKKNVVFIDSGFHFHPDAHYHKKLKIHKNKEFDIQSFAKKINHLFLNLRKEGYKIFFLSHPKIIKKNQNIYKHCIKIDYNIFDYIKYSDLVIWSGSSTIDFPIIYKKKILIINSREIKSYPKVQQIINSLKKFFNAKELNLDNLNNLNKKIEEFTIHPNGKYKKYFNEFVKHPSSQNLKYSDIITKILKKTL